MVSWSLCLQNRDLLLVLYPESIGGPSQTSPPGSHQPLLSAHAEFGFQNLQLAPPLLYLASSREYRC